MSKQPQIDVLAVFNYESANGRFPSGCNVPITQLAGGMSVPGLPGPALIPTQYISLMALFLFMEQDNLL